MSDDSNRQKKRSKKHAKKRSEHHLKAMERSRVKPGVGVFAPIRNQLLASWGNASQSRPPSPDDLDGVAIRVSQTEKTVTSQLPHERAHTRFPPNPPVHGERSNPTGDRGVRPVAATDGPFQWSPVLFFLCAIVIGLGGIAVFDGEPVKNPSPDAIVNETEAASLARVEELKKRAEFYQVQTGVHMNRQRIDAELENLATAPGLSAEARKLPAENPLAGLPLQGERHHRESSRSPGEPISPDDVDSRILYRLEEESAALEWEKRAREAYIQEFITNAKDAGYRVRVDSDGRVDVQRMPQSQSAGRAGAGQDSHSGAVK